jgi:hypothetical protein
MKYDLDKRAVIDCLDSAAVTAWPRSNLILTSPPYAYYEQYRCAKGRVIEPSIWMRDFLCPILHACWASLQVGGHMIIHIGNVRVRRDILYLVNDLIDGVSWEAPIGLYGVYGDGKRAMYAEPLLVWRKNA